MIAVDSNLLVYAHRTGTPQHRASRRAIERAAADDAGWGIAVATMSEFWSVVTHPSARPRPSRPREAAAFLRILSEDAGMRVWAPGADFGNRLLQLALDLDVSGPRVFDLQIALTVFEHGAHELWTHDERFVRVPGLRVIDPL